MYAVAAAAIVYLACGAFLILLLSLLFTYLLERLVTWVQHHSRLGQRNRTWAIAQAYLIGTLPYAITLGALGGVLKFLPAVGWIASAVAIQTVGFLTHSHWIWMPVLVVGGCWRRIL